MSTLAISQNRGENNLTLFKMGKDDKNWPPSNTIFPCLAIINYLLLCMSVSVVRGLVWIKKTTLGIVDSLGS